MATSVEWTCSLTDAWYRDQWDCRKKSTTRLLTLEPSLPAVVAVDDGEKVLLDLDCSAIFDVAVAS
jgi:hypothetical protein